MEVTIAYLILCHAQPEQVARLIAALPATSPIFIHVDARAGQAIYDAIAALVPARPQLRFVRRHRCFWSGYGIIKATNELIGSALASGLAFDYATLLSGADYPIKSNAHIARQLAQSPGAEFIEAFPLHEENRWSGHEGLYHGASRVDWFHLRFRSRAWRLPWRRTLPHNYAPWGGSQWWTLTRAALDHIARIGRETPSLPRFFRNVFLPDECYVQTILANSPFRDAIMSDDLRLTIWDRPEPPYPATLKACDFGLLAGSDKLFARKFDLAQGAHIFDLIDERLRNGSEL